jgi:hypothetical protein
MKKVLITAMLCVPFLSFAGTNHPALDTLLELLTEKNIITPEEAMKIAAQLRKDVDERNKEIQSMIKKAMEEKSK